jgi:hypothetical protein
MHVKFQSGPLIKWPWSSKKLKIGSEIYNIPSINKNLSFFVGSFMKFVSSLKVLK